MSTAPSHSLNPATAASAPRRDATITTIVDAVEQRLNRREAAKPPFIERGALVNLLLGLLMTLSMGGIGWGISVQVKLANIEQLIIIRAQGREKMEADIAVLKAGQAAQQAALTGITQRQEDQAERQREAREDTKQILNLLQSTPR